MLGNCPVIEIFPEDVGLFATFDGRVILDVDTKTSISIDLALSTQNQSFAVVNTSSIATQLPISPKNLYYLKELFDPNTDKTNGIYLTVRFTVGSETLIFNRLFGVTKTKESIEVRLSYGEDWINQLKNLSLSDLQTADQPGYLGTIDFTTPNVLDRWANNAKYEDGDAGYWYPLVHYGGWREKEYNIAVVEDLRPWLHTLFVMQKMFERIGWCLQFPFYETDLGRRCIDYLLKSDYGDSQSLRNRRKFRAKKVYNFNTVWTFGQIGNWDELSDPGNSFDEASGRYGNVFQGRFKLRVTLTGSISLLSIKFKLFKRREIIGGFTVSLIGEFTIPLFSTPGDHSFEFETIVTPTETVHIEFESGDLNFIIGPCIMTIYWSNEVESTYHANGDVINLGYEIDPKISAWDYLMGNVHFCSGIIVEQQHERIVKILTPFTADIFGETIEGYFDNTLVRLTSQQPLNSTNSAILDRLRFIKMAFAKTTDELAKQLNEDDTIDFYSKTIDTGDFSIETDEMINPLFEHTLLFLEDSIIHLEDIDNGSLGYYLPQCTDNDEGEVSNKIAPRKIIAYGYGPQGSGTTRIVFENQLYTDIAFGAQVSQSVAGNDITFNGSVPEQRFVYGDMVNDLWSLVNGRFIIQFKGRIQLDSIAYFTHKQFFELNLRNQFEIDYDGHPVTGRILQIQDFRPCELLSAQLLLMPEVTVENYCVETDDETNCQANGNLFIIANLVENCWNIALDGESECNILTLAWEIQYESDDPGTWTSLGGESTIQVCDADEWFIIRVTVTFDCPECPDVILTHTVYPCTSGIICSLVSIYSDGQRCLQWDWEFEDGTIGTDCTYTATLEVYVGGVLIETLTLVLNELICPLNYEATYILTVEVNCNNGCPDLVTTCTYIPNQPRPRFPQGCDNYPVLICNPVTVEGVICYEFILEGGIQQNLPETFIVTYECIINGVSQGIKTWHPGDPPVCCAGILSAHALVFYCDCPSVCTETIECEAGGCIPFDSGVWSPLAVCN